MHPETLLALEMLSNGQWADVADLAAEPGWVRRMAELGLPNRQPGETLSQQSLRPSVDQLRVIIG